MEASWLEILPVKQSYWGRARYDSMFVLVPVRLSRCAGAQKMRNGGVQLLATLHFAFGGHWFGLSSATTVLWINNFPYTNPSQGHSGWRSVLR